MKIARTRLELERELKIWRAENLRTGFVPTMGALHEGHLSLVRIALENSDRCVASVFVNPTQFAPHEDYRSYPRQEEQDLALLEKSGTHLVYIPDMDEMYPDGFAADMKAGLAARELESFFRPHFFDGVVTVVRKLFDHVQPQLAVFGEKDYQQLCVIREMVLDDQLPIAIRAAPIIRDSKGLALSSRNAYFTPEQLRQAQALNEILFTLAAQFRISLDKKPVLIAAAIEKIRRAGFEEVQYLELRDAETLRPIKELVRAPARLLVAAKLAGVRLIDNVAV
ncbi:MAG: pantoate--beta-alanine ligase [Alphaproteobacteria bacterium]